MDTSRTAAKIVTANLSATILCLAASAAWGEILHVANHGVDAPACGRAAAPCRSIGQAIANAREGATILVGPGTYGDIDGDSLVGEPGEEEGGVRGMVVVDKRVSLLSTHGAGSTVIDASTTRSTAAVTIAAGDVVFGRKNRGFTLINSREDGLHVEAGADGVAVAGNVTVNDRVQGFAFFGTNAVVRDNWALGTPIGFFGAEGAVAMLDGNVALNSRSVGFTLFDVGGAVVRRNVATNNGVGLYLTFATAARGPLADFSWNTVTGSKQYGVRIDAYDLPEQGFTQTMRANNFYGNGSLFYSSAPNCGLMVANSSSHALVIDATDNFWGGAGPGPDPADTAGDLCNYGGSTQMILATSSARAFRAKLKPIR